MGKLILPASGNVYADAQVIIYTLVQKCLDARGLGCEEWEAEINERVAALYGL